MKKVIVITDLTRMHEGRVCIAGYDRDLSCIRPVLRPPGIQECTLSQDCRPMVFPSAEVEFDFGLPAPHPPHTEDVYFMPGSIRHLGRLSESCWRALLTSTLSARVAHIFEQEICTEGGCHVFEGQGTRSLGTVQPQCVTGVVYRERKTHRWEYRVGFIDAADVRFELPVTDLAWRYFIDRQRLRGLTPCAIADIAAEMLQHRAIFLRIGLARGWVEHPGECYLQITGVHTFPDYLIGLTWADYAPRGSRGLPA